MRKSPPPFHRESVNPSDGNWSLAIHSASPGVLHHSFAHLNLGGRDTLRADVQSSIFPSPPAAQLSLTDATGHTYTGQTYRLFRPWQTITLDLRAARDAGLTLEDITDISLRLTPGTPDARCDCMTDHWIATTTDITTVGDPAGAPGTFYVQQQGEHLHIGQVGRFEVTFSNRSGGTVPWMALTQGSAHTPIFGAPGTGLALLDQDHFDQLAIMQTRGPLAGALRASDDGATPPPEATPGLTPMRTLGSANAVFHWRLEWSCPFAALVDVRQTGPAIERNGRPGFTADWRWLIYRTGQAYVRWQCTRDPASTVPLPVSWALGVAQDTVDPPEKVPETLLNALYSGPPRTLWPYQFQRGMPAGLIAEVGDRERNLNWWSTSGGATITGTGLPTRLRDGPLDCMLLLNHPTLLSIAGESGAALQRTVPTMGCGTLDTHFPGDPDNDGFVDALGFYAIRLNHGRAILDLDPGNRPLFYPAFLFTDADAPGGAPRPLLINVDGQAWEHAPRWPDGSALLQLPYVIDRPVHIEVSVAH